MTLPPPSPWDPALYHVLPGGGAISRDERRACCCGQTLFTIYRRITRGVLGGCRVACPRCLPEPAPKKDPETGKLIRPREVAIGTYDSRQDVVELEASDE